MQFYDSGENFHDQRGYVNVSKNFTIRELAHRNARNRNHITRDDELRNAKIELSSLVNLSIVEKLISNTD
jgi:hypothetical protein